MDSCALYKMCGAFPPDMLTSPQLTAEWEDLTQMDGEMPLYCVTI